MKPSDLPSLSGPEYVMFSLLYSGGRHGLHSDEPHGSVMGSRNGYEHCEHWKSRIIARASCVGFNPAVPAGGAEVSLTLMDTRDLAR